MNNKMLFIITFINLNIATLLVRSSSPKKTRNATRTDLTQCKLTHVGTEFKGHKATTAGGIRCQSWHTQDPLHKVSSEIKDNDFPERSMRLAKNYCRNPTRDPKGPWCYTMEPSLIDDDCGIPLCNYGECRISGTGAEYGGTKMTSVTGRKCKSWNKRHKLQEGRTEKFSNTKFSDLSRNKAKNFCRNPNDDTGGPWCYIEAENFETVEKEYCDIPFCDDKDCLVYARNASVYSTLTKLNETYGNITLWVKLWNPADEQNAEARLLLSLVPIPTSAKKIAQDWRAGVEIVISNAGSGQTYPTSGDEQDFENTRNIIIGSKWTGLWINWGGGFISVGLYGSTKPLFMDQYKKKHAISSLYPDNFLHYGLMGTGILWSTEFCQEACEVHTTFGMEYLRVWPLQPGNTTYDIRFNVRASRDIAIRLYQTAGSLFPCFTISIGTANTVTLVYQKTEKSSQHHLKDMPGKSLLDFWIWKEFTLSIFGSDLRLFSRRLYGNEEILHHEDDLFGTIRWFSVGSRNNIAMWTFFCDPESDPVEKPSPPNCIANLEDFKYEGSQWTSVNEMPCVPWISLEVPDDDKKHKSFVDGSAAKAINKCRNPGRDPKGPYCYSISLENSLTVSKQYCPIRQCRFSECRMAGTGNDYVGTLSVTRSGRTCAKWMSDYDYKRMRSGKMGAVEPTKTASATPIMTIETETRSQGTETTSSTETEESPTSTSESATTTSEGTTSASTTSTAVSTKNATVTTRGYHVWKVDEFLTREQANVTFSSPPTPGDDYGDDFRGTRPKVTKTTTMSTPSTESTEDTTSTESTTSTADSTPKTTGTTRGYHVWKVDEFLTRKQANVTFSSPPTPGDDYGDDFRGTRPKVTKSTTMSTPSTESTEDTTIAESTTSTADSTPKTTGTTKGYHVWKVDEFLTRKQANVTFSSPPTPGDDYGDDFRGTRPKVTKTTTMSTPSTESTEDTTIAESTTSTTDSTPKTTGTTKGYHVWKVDEFLTRKEANVTFSSPPTPGDDYGDDFRGTRPKETKSTTKSTQSTASTEDTTIAESTTSTADSTPKTTGTTRGYHVWKVDEFLTRKEANVTFSSPPTPGDDYGDDFRGTRPKVTKSTTMSTASSTQSTASIESTTSIVGTTSAQTSPATTSNTTAKKGRTFHVWKVDEYLKLHDAGITVDWGPTPEDFNKEWDTYAPTDNRRSKRAPKPIHPVNPAYFNDSLYPEHSVRNASNYCRDPSRNIAGTWCYTTDPKVPQDLCDVRDCDMPEECIFFVRGQGVGRRLYVLPEHRTEGLDFSLKAWEPDEPDSITFVFTADDGFKSRYILKVGAQDNEKVMLYYQDEEKAMKLVKTKTLPHLLYLGKWSSFVIKVPRGHVMIYYQGSPNPLFQWDHPEPAKAFLPIYYYYTSEKGHTIGVSFDCATRCHIENTQTEKFSRVLPLSIWSKGPVSNPNRIQLMIRGEGIVRIPLLMFPGVRGYYGLTLGEQKNSISFVKKTYPRINVYHRQKAPAPILTRGSWTNITLAWFNRTIDVFWNETPVFHYEHTHPLLFYYFSLAVDKGGWATWVANCIPPDIDGDPQDGGWSEWSPWACSASCNGGVGTRKRVCNNPMPNVKGEPCLGPDIMSGRCNTIACGDITDDTAMFIKRRIRRNHTALSVKEDNEITIPADPDIIKAITTESPDSEIQWSHNGIFLYPDQRLVMEDNNIVIKRARLNDSGVYTITFHRVDGTHMIFKMASLVVYPVKTVVTIRETLPLTVVCHSVTLGYLYSDLKISWTIGKKLWKDYGTTLPVSVNVDTVPAVNETHKGLWECVIEQDDLGFKWITNAIFVNVIGPPNWRTHLMEDEFTRPIFGWMPSETFVAVSAGIIFLALTACIVVGTGYYTRFRKMGRFVGPVEKKVRIAEMKKVEPRKFASKSEEVETIGAQYVEGENKDDENVESRKKRKSLFRRTKTNEEANSERRKLIADTETEESS